MLHTRTKKARRNVPLQDVREKLTSKNFVRRIFFAINKETNRREQSNLGIIPLYIKRVFELISIFLQPQRSIVAYRRFWTSKRSKSNSKQRPKTGEWRRLLAKSSTWTAKKMLYRSNRRKNDYSNVWPQITYKNTTYSLISVHEDQERYRFNLDNVQILVPPSKMHVREFLKPRVLQMIQSVDISYWIECALRWGLNDSFNWKNRN